MTDIVDEAKELIPWLGDDTMIERLTKEVERLREALEKASDALHDAGLHDAWADVRKALKQ